VAELDRVIHVMEMVQADCHDEAMKLDGKPFDGQTVAKQFGNMLAEISAVAKAVEVLARIERDRG
jgi:hypothetical protein